MLLYPSPPDDFKINKNPPKCALCGKNEATILVNDRNICAECLKAAKETESA